MGKKRKKKFAAIETVYRVWLVSPETDGSGEWQYQVEMEAISNAGGLEGRATFALWLNSDQMSALEGAERLSMGNLHRKRQALVDAGLMGKEQ